VKVKMSLPSVEVVRERIEQVRKEDVRTCLMCAYLFAARVSELVAYATPGDTTVARGPRGTDVRLFDFNGEEAAVFTVYTAKREGLERYVALPLNPIYEPWTRVIYDYYQKRGSQACFPFTRQKLWKHSCSVFEGLTYMIDKYKTKKKSRVYNPKRHPRNFRLHGLRHLRTAELIERYEFDGFDLSIYGGWTLRYRTGISSSIDRYAHLRWKKYFPKLLKKRE